MCRCAGDAGLDLGQDQQLSGDGVASLRGCGPRIARLLGDLGQHSERLSQNFAADQRENLRIVEGSVQLRRQRLPAVGEVSTLLHSTDSAGAGLALAKATASANTASGSRMVLRRSWAGERPT